jgi:diacylglycerol kinase family enzyme
MLGAFFENVGNEFLSVLLRGKILVVPGGSMRVFARVCHAHLDFARGPFAPSLANELESGNLHFDSVKLSTT